MNNSYGVNRVIEPSHVLPTVAWKVDNRREIYPKELRIGVKRVHLEGTSFKQISMEANGNEGVIKNIIMDIVIKRGKLHNPVTDTGGVLYGVVEEIGSEYDNPKNFKVGDEVLCNASLSTVPLYLERITGVNNALGQVEVEGYAIAFNEIPLVEKPADLPADLLLFTFNESGTLFRVSQEAFGKSNILVVGNNLMINLLYGYTVRRAVGSQANVVCLLDKKTELMLKGPKVDKLISRVFNELNYVNILKPLECLAKLNIDALFDMSINCANIPGAETINILATKSGGSVFFANLINNYNIALYITESISRQLDIHCADGYLEAYDEFDIQITKELEPYLSNVYMGNTSFNYEPPSPRLRNSGLKESLGYQAAVADGFVCESAIMAQTIEEVLRVAKYDCHILITGDTGVGKEKIANMIQKNSSRKLQPYLKINCASISPSLMDSEFFGYEKGSFTGASQSGKKGYFETADNGILFLDEIGEIPADLQAKLLRVLQDGEFYRVGGIHPVKTNVRILSATNKDLESLVEHGIFRRDLYYRLNVFPIRVPKLEERREDIPALIKHFLDIYGEKFGILRGIHSDVVSHLTTLEWPGNIRELENLIQRLMITTTEESITLMSLMKELHKDIFQCDLQQETGSILQLSVALEDLEKTLIENAKNTYGSTRKAAAALGISQTQFVRKTKKYELQKL